jgi:hypothetical protein
MNRDSDTLVETMEVKLPTTLFDLLNSHLCTEKQIISRLQRLQEELGSEVVKCSGPTKKEIVDHFALLAGRFETAKIEAQNLLRDSEENGAQHIHLYRPKSKEVLTRLADGNSVAHQLWGADWLQKKKFPKFTLKSEALTIADFRYSERAPGRDFWTLKTYGHKVGWDPQAMNTSDDGEKRWREWHRKESRSVYVVRLNRHSLLEVRVPRAACEKDDRQNMIDALSLISDVVSYNDFEPFCLQKSRRRFYSNRAKYSNRYRIGPFTFLDSKSTAVSYEPHSQTEQVDPAAEAAESADLMNANAKTSLRKLCMTWLGDKVLDEHKDGLPIEVGGKNTNRISIPSRSTERVVNYVIDEFIKNCQ